MTNRCRFGFPCGQGLSGAHLKIMQECVTLAIFVPFVLIFLGEKWKWGYLWVFTACWGRFSSSSGRTVVETLPTPRCNIHIMKTPLLALLVAASVALAANTSTNTNKKPSGPTPPGGNKTATAEKVATTEKKPKKEAKAEAPAADPVSLVVQTVDATTQMALDAAKAAQAEADKLAAIGSGKAAAGPSNAKLAEAAVGTGVAVAKELSKPKKEADSEEKPEPKKPEPKAEKKPAAEKPKKAAGA